MGVFSRHIARLMNAAGPLGAAVFVIGGLLGPDLHSLAHVPDLREPLPADCLFDGGAHFEDDWSSHRHPDCTLCQRITVTSPEDPVAWDQSPARSDWRISTADFARNQAPSTQRNRGPPQVQ